MGLWQRMLRGVAAGLLVACVMQAGCHGSAREVGLLRTSAMMGVPLEKEGARHGYTPEASWDLGAMNAPQRELYLRIQVYRRARGDTYDAKAITEAAKYGFDVTAVKLSPTQLRDEVAAVLLAQALWFQQGMEDDVYEAVGTTQSLFDLAGLVLNAVGATTGAAADKAAYNAAAGAVLGFRSSLEKNFLAEQTQQAIMHTMEAQWLAMRNQIVRRMQAEDDSKYPLTQIALDVREMASDGRLADAVSELARKAAEAAKTEQETAKTLRLPAAERK